MKKSILAISLCLLAAVGYAKDSITTSLVAQTVTVKYDADKISEENLIKSFQDFKYEARKLKPGEKVVREKHECKEEQGVVYETE